MSLRRDREGAEAAAANLLRLQVQLGAETRWIQIWAARHRPALLVAGGLLAGVVLGRLRMTRVLRALLSTLEFSASHTAPGWITQVIDFGIRGISKRLLPARTDAQG